MAMRVQVSCINKRDRQSPYERISFIGGVHNGKRWKLSEDDAIKGIENGTYSFYVERPTGHIADVMVAKNAAGGKYLKTTADGETPDNLLSLPECP